MDWRRRREETLYNPEDSSAAAAKGMRSDHCEVRFVKLNFDDFDDSDKNSNDGAIDQ